MRCNHRLTWRNFEHSVFRGLLHHSPFYDDPLQRDTLRADQVTQTQSCCTFFDGGAA